MGVFSSLFRRRRVDESSEVVVEACDAYASDVLEMVTVFSARMYGARSHRNKRLIESVEQAVMDAARP